MRESRRAFVAALALLPWLDPARGADQPAIELRPRSEAFESAEAIAPEQREAGQLFALREGARLGEVTLSAAWRDFRGQSIAPGRYGLRYALQPRLKEHVGADAIRDFALLVPSGIVSSADWREESRRVSGTKHPAVMALVSWEGTGEPPATLHEESADRLVLFRTVGSTSVGFVILGRAPEPEL